MVSLLQGWAGQLAAHDVVCSPSRCPGPGAASSPPTPERSEDDPGGRATRGGDASSAAAARARPRPRSLVLARPQQARPGGESHGYGRGSRARGISQRIGVRERRRGSRSGRRPGGSPASCRAAAVVARSGELINDCDRPEHEKRVFSFLFLLFILQPGKGARTYRAYQVIHLSLRK